MDGWLGALVSLSLMLAAAPALATASPVEQMDHPPSVDEDPEINWETPLLVDVIGPRVYLETSLEKGTANSSLEVQMADTETKIDVMATHDEDEPLRDPVTLKAESGGSGACVIISPTHYPPVGADPDCLPPVDDAIRPVR